MPNPVPCKFLGDFVLNLQAEQCRILGGLLHFLPSHLAFMKTPLSLLRLVFNDSCAELTVYTSVTMTTVTNDRSKPHAEHTLSLQKGSGSF